MILTLVSQLIEISRVDLSSGLSFCRRLEKNLTIILMPCSNLRHSHPAYYYSSILNNGLTRVGCKYIIPTLALPFVAIHLLYLRTSASLISVNIWDGDEDHFESLLNFKYRIHTTRHIIQPAHNSVIKLIPTTERLAVRALVWLRLWKYLFGAFLQCCWSEVVVSH